MSPTADATLLPPPLGFDDDDDRFGFERHERGIDHVGPTAVLGAMVEQRRASQPDLEEIEEVEAIEDVNDTLETPAVFDDDIDADATQPLPAQRRVPANSDAFLKAR